MSPEQVRGDPLDGRSDLFSLGVVCYELLTGVKPFGGESVSSVLYRIVHERPRDAALHLERVAPPLAAFLERALAKDPAARYPDGAAFAAALRRAGAEAERAAPRPSEPPERPLSTEPLPARGPSSRRSIIPWIVVGLALAALGVSYVLKLGPFAPPAVPMLTARVHTEPGGLPVRLNGAPFSGDVVRFPASGPFPVLSASEGCREAKHRLEAADAGGEVALVLDPLRAAVAVDPGVPGARLAVNGREAGAAPASIDLDLCRDNTIELRAEGYRTSRATIPAKATPLEARNAAASLKLEAIPTGRLIVDATRVPVQLFVDGERAKRASGSLDLPAGTHEIRATSEDRFVDITVSVDVPAGGTATTAIPIPPLARLVVQTFPPNCRVAIKRADSPWRPVGETPLRYEVAAGRYVVRVESPASGETREQSVDLAPGANPPVRVSFGRTGR
jgi:hypothetical protein